MNGRAPRSLLVSVAVAAALAGCGGGGGAEPEPERCFETSLQNCGPGPWDPFGIALSFAWNFGQCTREVACTQEPVETDIDAGIVTDEYINANWTVSTGVEREPNDSRAQAVPFVINAGGRLRVTGNVNDADDPADFYAFSTRSFDLHAAYVCRELDTCTLPFLQTDEIYIELRDQDGNLIRTTDMMQTSNGHEIPFTPSQGVGYFLVVRAANTGPAGFDYELIITD